MIDNDDDLERTSQENMKYINMKNISKQSKQIKKPYTQSLGASKDLNDELLAHIVSTFVRPQHLARRPVFYSREARGVAELTKLVLGKARARVPSVCFEGIAWGPHVELLNTVFISCSVAMIRLSGNVEGCYVSVSLSIWSKTLGGGGGGGMGSQKMPVTDPGT